MIRLTPEELDLLMGGRGAVSQKVMRTLARFAVAMGAERFVEVGGGGHFSIPSATVGIGPRIETLDELAEAGLRAALPFTLDPRSPEDMVSLGVTEAQAAAFRVQLKNQPRYDERMLQLGLRGPEWYTCTPYLPEVGVLPQRGTILAWSESSCVVYANSVLGARTHRNAAIIDLLSNLVGRTPLAGFLTDAGRTASWRVELRTTRLPPPQLLGAAVGAAVMEDVPYICGLDHWLGDTIDARAVDYFKEMGAACAALGAVGLYHVENLTPEAIEQGRGLLQPGHRTLVIDDATIRQLLASYARSTRWTPGAAPQKALVGCPHLSLRELLWWSQAVDDGLAFARRSRITVPTVLCAAPQVLEAFRAQGAAAANLAEAGVTLSAICSESYMDNPLCAAEAVVTNSNKLRAFTGARLLSDERLVRTIITGEMDERDDALGL